VNPYVVPGLLLVVLVTVGIGHHLAVGLAMVALLAGSSPWVIRWIAGRA